jgi:hypothetical protein
MWHGCDYCYYPTSFNPITNCQYQTLKLRQDHKINYIHKQYPTYKIIQLWEHQFNHDKLVDAHLRDWIKKQEIVEPINVRDCLYGGRTNALVLYHKCRPGEQIKYYDIT